MYMMTKSNSVANTLEIYDYLLQHGTDIDTANAACHVAHYVNSENDAIHKTVDTFCIALSSEKDQAMATVNMYRKFCAVWICDF